MAKKRANHNSTIRTLAKGIYQLASEVGQGRELGELQAIFSRVANSIASNPELATEENIDVLGRLLNARADSALTITVIVGLHAIATRTDLSFGAADHVVNILIEALKDADMRRGVEYQLMDSLTDIAKEHNTFAHEVAGGLLSFLHDNKNSHFSLYAGGYLAAIAINASGTLRVKIEEALLTALNSENAAEREGGIAGLRVFRNSKMEALKNLAETLPPATPSP